jgi:serine/threonine protein kinase
MTGTTVGHYRVLDRLGAGGMGVVYRAEDVRLGRMVAVKFLSEELSGNPSAVSRFER